ncbi:MAG: zinc-ribbon domain-containing protein [Candidatus Thorarchaeota archaeon]
MFCPNCGVSIPDDAEFCPKCGKSLEETKSLLRELPTFLDNKKEEIQQLIQEKKHFGVVKVLECVLNKVKQENIKIFYDFFKEILSDYPHLFESKAFYRGYLKNLTRILSYNQLTEMETYLIDQICTYEDEKVGVATIGKLFYLYLIFSGRIYITEFRIIVIGTRNKNWEMIKQQRMQRRNASATLTASIPLLSLIPGRSLLSILLLDRITERAIEKAESRKTGRILREKGKIKPIVKIGSQFPIKESFVSLENDKIEFTSIFTDYRENVRISYNLVPTPYTGEANEEYLERVKNILEKIKELKGTKVIRAFQPSKLKPIKY